MTRFNSRSQSRSGLSSQSAARRTTSKLNNKQDGGMFFFEHENRNKIIHVKLNVASNNQFQENLENK